MQNYFNKLPRKLRSKESKVIPLLVIGVAFVGIFSVVSIISENTDIRNLAASINTGHIPSGCYYVRGQCTGSQTPGATASCKPILVCPTNTPTITPTEAVTPTQTPVPTEVVVPTISACVPRPACLDANPPCLLTPPTAGWCPPSKLGCGGCLAEGASSLCLELTNKTSSCSTLLEATFDQTRVCVPCKPLPPSPTPYRCFFRPACLDAIPPCTDTTPIEGWCTIGSPNIIFQQ